METRVIRPHLWATHITAAELAELAPDVRELIQEAHRTPIGISMPADQLTSRPLMSIAWMFDEFCGGRLMAFGGDFSYVVHALMGYVMSGTAVINEKNVAITRTLSGQTERFDVPVAADLIIFRAGRRHATADEVNQAILGFRPSFLPPDPP
jgi:hypothetical protein